MNNDEPDVNLNSRYSVAETCRLLGIHRNTLRKYTESGCIKVGIRKATGRKFYLGKDILNFWKKQL